MAIQSDSFAKRFWTYQKERFPLIAHGVMIAAFTFSAVSYSRICRGAEGFINTVDFLVGVFATITLFLLVRICDEFKDQEEDLKYRPHLPVPRGLVSLKELKWLGYIITLVQLLVISLIQPQMLLLYVIVLGYLMLMRIEFFVPKWLKAHHIIYIASHMMIIPLIDLYASGLDWKLADDRPHAGLIWFFAVSFFNGIVLEFGRKIRPPKDETEGVLTYTKFFGPKGGVIAWITIMFLTMSLAIGAADYAEFGSLATVILIALFAISSIPGLLFLRNPSTQKAKLIELTSAGWTISMYLTLGAIPMIKSLLS